MASPSRAKRSQSLSQVALRLRKPKQTIARWISQGKLKATHDEVTGTWTVDPESEAEMAERIDAAESEDEFADPVAEQVAALIAANTRMANTLDQLTTTMAKPLALYLDYNERLLKIAIDRNSALEKQNDEQREKYDVAMSHANERELAIQKQQHSLKLQDEAFGYLKEVAPQVLKFGPVMQKIEDLAPWLGAIPPQEVENMAASFEGEPNIGRKGADALRDIAQLARQLLKEQVARTVATSSSGAAKTEDVAPSGDK